MQTLFGVAIGQLLTVLAIVFAVVVVIVAVMALRHRVTFLMGVRNLPRRPAQTVLVVIGLMLATVIFSASFATGDTLTHSIRVMVLDELGRVDVVVRSETEDATGRFPSFDEARFDEVADRLRDVHEVEGVAPLVTELAPVVAAATGLSEPQVHILGMDAARLAGFDRPRTATGEELNLAALPAGEAYVSNELTASLDVAAGESVLVFLGAEPAVLSVAGVYVDGVDPAGDLSVVLPLEHLQSMTGNPGLINRVVISNAGDPVQSAAGTDAVLAALQPLLSGTGLEAVPLKQDALREADEVGAQFSEIFLLFGQFSVAAGILLIFLIFVMLAAERKREMGIARAVGMQRIDLVRMFTFEGALYALLAAAVGSLLGLGVGWALIRLMSVALGEADLQLTYLFNWRSLALAYILGAVLTFGVVVMSAWWVSRLNIVRSIRDIPEPGRRGQTWRSLVVIALLPLAGVLLTVAGLQAEQAGPFFLGTSLLIIGVPMVVRRVAGLPDRGAFTIAGLGLVGWWLLPQRVFERIPGLPDFEMGIEMFFLSGIMIVLGAVWVVIYNSDLLLGGTVRLVGRVPGLAPILRTAVSYPMQNRFRTGVTLAMFSLVVFTLVVMAFITNSIFSVFEDAERMSGGFDIRASVSPANPLPDLATAIKDADGLELSDFAAIGSMGAMRVNGKQAGSAAEAEEAILQSGDSGWLEATTYDMAMMAEGFRSSRDVWAALQEEPNTAVVSGALVPRRSDFSMGAPPPPFLLEGFYLEDRVLPEVFITVLDPRSGNELELKVIGVMDALAFYGGLMLTSTETLDALRGEPAPPVSYMLRVAPDGDAGAIARALRLAFAEHGMQAEVIADEIAEMTRANRMMNQLLQGFMALGLVVGIAALGVIAARSVVERRQEIGVMRALGFQREMVQASFLLESSFIALLGIILGTALASGLSVYIVSEVASEFEGVTWSVPRLNLGIIALVAYGASLLTTFLPAYQASRIMPAEALHLEQGGLVPAHARIRGPARPYRSAASPGTQPSGASRRRQAVPSARLVEPGATLHRVLRAGWLTEGERPDFRGTFPPRNR